MDTPFAKIWLPVLLLVLLVVWSILALSARAYNWARRARMERTREMELRRDPYFQQTLMGVRRARVRR